MQRVTPNYSHDRAHIAAKKKTIAERNGAGKKAKKGSSLSLMRKTFLSFSHLRSILGLQVVRKNGS